MGLMSLFDKAKLNQIDVGKSQCQMCNKNFEPDKRNLNRGWGLCCSKSCATTYKNKLKKMKGGEFIKEMRDLRLSQIGIK